MPKLSNITIGGFRGLRDLRLRDLGKVNLLVGPNDSGKTSILEALAIFCRPLDLRVWIDAAWRREAMLNPEDSFFLSLEWMFPHGRSEGGPFVSGEVVISGSGAFPVRQARATYKPITRFRARAAGNGDGADDIDQAQLEQPGAHIQLTATAVSDSAEREQRRTYDLWEGDPLVLQEQDGSLALPISTVTAVSHRVEQQQLQGLSEVTLRGLKSQFISLLSSLDSQILDVQILSPKGKRPVIYIDYRNAGLLPLTALGDGIRRALMIALQLNSAGGGVLLIDEIESSLHVTALGTLFSWLVKSCEKLDVQLFATTHSLEAVDAMIQAESENLNVIAGYRLERLEERVEARRLDGQLLFRLREERGLDVRL